MTTIFYVAYSCLMITWASAAMLLTYLVITEYSVVYYMAVSHLFIQHGGAHTWSHGTIHYEFHLSCLLVNISVPTIQTLITITNTTILDAAVCNQAAGPQTRWIHCSCIVPCHRQVATLFPHCSISECTHVLSREACQTQLGWCSKVLVVSFSVGDISNFCKSDCWELCFIIMCANCRCDWLSIF